MPKVDTFADAKKEIERLKTELAAKGKGNGGTGSLTARVGPSGAVVVYGLGRFPTSLHANQWSRLEEAMTDAEGTFRKAFDMLKADAMAGETLANGRPAGNAAHQQRVRDAEARKAAKAS